MPVTLGMRYGTTKLLLYTPEYVRQRNIRLLVFAPFVKPCTCHDTAELHTLIAIDFRGVRWWGTPTHEPQLLRYHSLIVRISCSNDIGYHLSTQAIALVRDRVFFF